MVWPCHRICTALLLASTTYWTQAYTISNDPTSDDISPLKNFNPDLSHCVLAPVSQRQWAYEGPSPDPYPPPDAASIPTPLNNSIPSTFQRPRKQRRASSTDPNPSPPLSSSLSEHCQEIKTLQITQPETENGGFYHTLPVPIDAPLKRYYLSWSTTMEGPVQLIAYLKNPDTKLWEREILGGGSPGERDWRSWPNRQGQALRVDVGFSPQGGGVDVGLFEITHPL